MTNKIEAEMALDVPTETLGQILDSGLFVDTTCGRPILALILPHTLPKYNWQLPMPHPPLKIPDAKL